MNIDDVLSQCEGIESIREDYTDWKERPMVRYNHYKTGDLVVPDGIYVEITASATTGTIGKLVDIDIETIFDDNKLGSSYWMTLIIKIDGRPKPSRIAVNRAKFLEDYTGPTQWVRNVKKHEKVILPPHVNKYNQTINKGDWLVGIGPSKTLYFGEVFKWTKTSVYVSVNPKDKSIKHHCISLSRESLLLPISKDEAEQMVTMMILSGSTNL